MLHRQVEQIVDVPVPQVVEEVVQVDRIVPQERVQQRTVEQIVEVPVPQMVEEVVHVPQIQVQERIVQNIVEQIVEVPRQIVSTSPTASPRRKVPGFSTRPDTHTTHTQDRQRAHAEKSPTFQQDPLNGNDGRLMP